jgi:hypothetical protein
MDSQDYLGAIELGTKEVSYDNNLHLLIKVSNSWKMEEELTTGTEFEHEVKLVLGLESVS